MGRAQVVLCRPRGGLNDNLNQIEQCWRYAERFNCILCIDTRRAPGLLLPFNEIFIVQGTRIKVISWDEISDYIDLGVASTRPVQVRTRLVRYHAEYDMKCRGYVDSLSKQPLTFSFGLAHQEDVLVHESSGGGRMGIECLARLTFKPRIKKYLCGSLAPLFRRDYDAVHIRNTDMATDFRKCLKKIPVRSEVYVSSDDHGAQVFAKELYGLYLVEKKLPGNSSPQPNIFKGGLHHYYLNKGWAEQHYAITNQFSDLIALSMSRTLFLCQTNCGVISGFARLAADLQAKKAILKNLTGEDLSTTNISSCVIIKISIRDQVKSLLVRIIRRLSKFFQRLFNL